MFASMKTDTVTLREDAEGGAPTEVTVTVQKLSWRQLREASEKATENAIRSAQAAGGDLLRAMRDVATPATQQTPDEKALAEREALYRQYDRGTVLRLGVLKWTHATKLPAGLDDLDEAAAETIHRKVLDISLPQKDEARLRGEDSGRSTSP
jgi:hypothetical protein